MNKKRIIFAFLVIFVIGIFTGGAIIPAIVHSLSFNPYSYDALSRKVFGRHFIDNSKLTQEEINATEQLIKRYLKDYDVARNNFSSFRKELNEKLIVELGSILPKEEFEKYKEKYEKDIKKRNSLHEKWKKDVKDKAK